MPNWTLRASPAADAPVGVYATGNDREGHRRGNVGTAFLRYGAEPRLFPAAFPAGQRRREQHHSVNTAIA
jgi:hypothetical protein